MHRIRGGETDRRRLVALVGGVIAAIILLVVMGGGVVVTSAGAVAVVVVAAVVASSRIGVDVDPRRGELRRWWGPGRPLWKSAPLRYDHFDELRVTQAVYRGTDSTSIYYYLRMHQADVPFDGTFLYRSSSLETTHAFASSLAEVTNLNLVVRVDEPE